MSIYVIKHEEIPFGPDKFEVTSVVEKTCNVNDPNINVTIYKLLMDMKMIII